MTKKFYCLELNGCAFFMGFCNLAFGLLFISVKASDLTVHLRHSDEGDLFFFCLGFLFILNAALLVYGTVKGKEKWVFFYLVGGSTSLIILTAASAFSKYDVKITIVVFIALWIGQVCVYSLYKKLLDTKISLGVMDIRFIDQNGVIHNIL